MTTTLSDSLSKLLGGGLLRKRQDEEEVVVVVNGEDPSLPHEYQFHLDLAEAEESLQDTPAFLARVTGG